VSPHSDRHPSGNEKCCSLAFCYPSAPKAWIGRGAQRGQRRRGSVVSFGRKQTPEPLVITELAVCPAKILSPGGSRRRTERRAPARVRRGCRGMRFSARGVAAMTEANGRPRVPHVLRKELAIPGRRASSSFRQTRGELAASAARLHRRCAGDLVRGKARGAPRSPGSDRASRCASRWDSISSPGSGERVATLSVSLEIFTLTPQ